MRRRCRGNGETLFPLVLETPPVLRVDLADYTDRVQRRDRGALNALTSIGS